MRKILSSKYWLLSLLIIILLVNYIASIFHFRIDLTEEKRYTLSVPTKKLVGSLTEPLYIDVFLQGEMPAGFRKLQNSVKETLQGFKEIGKGNIRFRFKKPLEGFNDSAKANMIDSLQRMGLSPMNVKAQTKEGEGQEQQFIFPGAILSYKDRVLAVDFLQGQSSVNGINSLNNAEALLEFKLTNAIHKLTQDSLPLIGYMLGNGQPFNETVYDLIERNLKRNYRFAFLPLDDPKLRAIPPIFDAILIVKPTKKFTDEQKLKIDQYIMHGGKVMWMIDNLYAEMDSLRRSQNEFIAFDRGLNLEDQLFKYGVRINQDLVQDVNSDKTPSVVGNVGGKPQIELVPWPYFPLLSNYSGHAIAKNLDYVLSQFPSSMDTVKAPGIKKTVLLSTSEASRILSAPALVSWNSVRTEADLRQFTKSNVPVVMLLEGKFNSLFTNRLSSAFADSLNAIHLPYVAQNSEDNKMIVASDGDIAMNAVTQDGALPMGMNPYTKYKYANSDFVNNAIEYLVDNSGILNLRGKDYTLRLLDRKKLDENKLIWQGINIALPILLILLAGWIFYLVRKTVNQKFSGSVT
ncbi:MAG: gliding motility-associated ABC transporter substrate-binding protein GldG [Bacteroidetes bacterium]|nr:MAG: gliding motility-associated ABC transporter substrate-binding protein GldG [Bacteroidota bacterium]